MEQEVIAEGAIVNLFLEIEIVNKALVIILLTDEHKALPEVSDFSLHWIETRPGKPHLKTGIPPSLYTFRISDFLVQSGKKKRCSSVSPIRIFHIFGVFFIFAMLPILNSGRGA